MHDFAADNRQGTLTVGRSTNQQPGQISPLLSAIAYPVPAKLSERPEQRRDRLEVATPLALGPLLAGSKGGWLGGTERGRKGGQKGTRHDGMGILVVACHCLPSSVCFGMGILVFIPAVSFGMLASLGCEPEPTFPGFL
jgi:hypothetical protein